MDRENIEDIYRLSPMQEGLLFQSEYDRGSHAYFLQFSFRFLGRFRMSIFEESWKHICRRHPALRSAFMYENIEQPLQVVLKERNPEVTFKDISDDSNERQQELIEDYMAEDRARGFDLARDVLMRIRVFKLDEETYSFVWSLHHILIDGWCYSILQNEFFAIYRALDAGQEPELPEPPPFSNYIRWLEKNFDKTAAASYWGKRLDGLEKSSPLPRAGKGKEYSSEEKLFGYDKELTEKIKKMAAKSSVTISSFFKAAWGLLLGRYCGTDDVVFGGIVSGRPHQLAGVEHMVGLFINIVPVRVSADGTEGFAALLKKVNRDALEAEPHNYYPLPDIISSNRFGRGLIDHLLVFQNYASGEELKNDNASRMDGDAPRIEWESAHDRTHYDLNIIVIPGDEIGFKVTYNSLACPEWQIDRMMGHLKNIIVAVTDDGELPVKDIDILSPEEREDILAASRGDRNDEYLDGEVTSLFEEQRRKNGESVAISFDGKEFSYEELGQLADGFAELLTEEHSLSGNEPVGILMERSERLPAAILGVMKAGGCYLPIDPEQPEERIGFMLRDSGCRLLIADGRLAKLAPGNIKVIKGDAVRPAKRPFISRAEPSDVAYLIYTSGSTGKPKGCQVEHRNLRNYLGWASGYYFGGEAEGDFGLYSSISFDLTITSLFLPLIRGRRLHIFRQDEELTGILAGTFGGEHGVDSVKLTPAHISLLKHMDIEASGIKLAIVGGEAMVEEHLTILKNINSGMTVVNEYGPTEATVGCVVKELDSGEGAIYIGRPIDNMEAFILDDHMRPVPGFVPGELYLGGASVARGYLNRPELNRQRFIESDISAGGRLYRTGDMARWRDGFEIDYLGRSDDQVKIRGFRVELGEIESRLLEESGIGSVAVAMKERGNGERLLAAYLVTSAGFSMERLKKRMRDELPEHMVPACYVLLDKLPLTRNGKVAKDMLPDPDEASARAKYVAPRNSLERELAEIWQTILRVEQVGVHDNFFELGGHSLKAMQVVSRIRKSLKFKVELHELFGHPTVAELAGIGKQILADDDSFPKAEEKEFYPLSHAQKRLWLEDRLGAGAAYNIPEAYGFDGDMDGDALEAAFAALIERHESLRTSFAEVDGEPVQRILEKVPFTIRRIDLRDVPDAEEELQRIMSEEAKEPFNLAEPPLIRVTLVSLPGNRQRLIMVTHHIVSDGWSTNVIYKELLALYGAFKRGEPNPLPPLCFQYKDFSEWQNRNGFKKEAEYWGVKMAEEPEPLRLPFDNQPAEGRSGSGSYETMPLAEELSDGIRELALVKSSSASNIILAIFKLFLFRLTGQKDICVGMSVAGRNREELEGMIGFFVNTLLVRTEMRDDMELGELLDNVIGSVYEALEHQDYPFDILAERFVTARLEGRLPFNVYYAFQNFHDIALEPDGVKGERLLEEGSAFKGVDIPLETSKFDLSLCVVDDGKRLHLTFEYDTSLFKKETIRGYLDILGRFAEAAVTGMTSGAAR